MKLNMTAGYGAPGYTRSQLLLCCDDLLRVLRASETWDPSVRHASVIPDQLSDTFEVNVQAEADTYEAAAAVAARRLDQAIATVMDDSPAKLEKLHSEVWCRKTPDIVRAQAVQEASRATPVESARGRPYAVGLLIGRLVGFGGFAAAAAFALSASQPGGPDLLLILGAVLAALLATAALICMALADLEACRREPRRPEDCER